MFRALGLVLWLVSFSAIAMAQVDATLDKLAKIRLDKSQIYSVRDITINRDVLSISLNRGAIAFTESIDGKVTGAVFIGSGDILAIPPDPVEKAQLFRYTKSALLNQRFETAIFRFTDGTFEEILKEYRRHAPDTVDPSDIEGLFRWESELQRRAVYLNERLLMDLIGNASRPFFLAQMEGTQLGWFDAIYDDRRVEEILLEQSTTASPTPLVWSSFNKRTDSRDPEAVAHEDKSLFDVVTADSEKGMIRLKLRSDGERVLSLPLPSAGLTRAAMDGAEIPFLPERDHISVILPAPGKAGAEIIIELSYAAGNPQAAFSAIADKARSLNPWSYRDQWIIEGLTGFAAMLADPSVLVSAREQLLATSADGNTNESAGPVSIGFRMTQAPTSNPMTLRNKSIWILHMLRGVMRKDERDPSFTQFLDEVITRARGARISTLEFKRLAEKHAGRSLDWFFDSWVFGTGIPEYTLRYNTIQGPNGAMVSGLITQSGVPDTFEMSVPVYAGGTLVETVMVSANSGEFRFSLPASQEILVDPRRTVLTRN